MANNTIFSVTFLMQIACYFKSIFRENTQYIRIECVAIMKQFGKLPVTQDF